MVEAPRVGTRGECHAKLADEYRVKLDLDLGPFPIKNSGPIIIRKSQLEP